MIRSFAWMVVMAALATLTWVGCSKYRNPDPEGCTSQADCNPGLTCGDLIQCVDGECDPDVVIELPCNQGCQSDADCPEGMHCRFDAGEEPGECVADGTCLDSSECQGLPHDQCAGQWSCEAGTCLYECQAQDNCSSDVDCVLADKWCCCGSTTEDYVAIHEDQLSDWQQREECRDVMCPAIACSVPSTILAYCDQGQCTLGHLQDLTACDRDEDCTVVPEGCCSCFDYPGTPLLSIREDQLSAWFGREECGDVLCEQCLRGPGWADEVCWGTECARAVCKLEAGQGHCGLDWADPMACEQDRDCAKAEVACPSCGCESGYQEGAVNASWAEAFQDWVDYTCMFVGACATGPFGTDACTSRPGVCKDGRCDVLGQGCSGCDDFWDPACVMAPNDAVHTFPNRCQAACAWGNDPFVVYPGRCECMMECDCVDEYGCAACAANGQTYHCSYGEIACNGLEPRYPGECDPACAGCGEIGREPIPACGVDFFTYYDIDCVACLGRETRHLGPCLSGEGAICGTSGGQACASSELFCLIEDNVPGASGRCIKLGTCLEAAHCEGQPLTGDPCTGHWECRENNCAWICG